jgi:hypothetical protein
MFIDTCEPAFAEIRSACTKRIEALQLHKLRVKIFLFFNPRDHKFAEARLWECTICQL